MQNNDGVWIKLTAESISQYCDGFHAEGWCLQFNQHLGKTLLVAVDQSKSIFGQVIKEALSRRDFHQPSYNLNGQRREKVIDRSFTVVKCGASGHNIRSKPNLNAPPVGMLVLGDVITIQSEIKTLQGEL